MNVPPPLLKIHGGFFFFFLFFDRTKIDQIEQMTLQYIAKEAWNKYRGKIITSLVPLNSKSVTCMYRENGLSSNKEVCLITIFGGGDF